MVTYVSNLYPALGAMIQWYPLFFFCGLGNVLLETYKEEALEERRMKMKRIRDFFKFDATL